MTGSGHFSRPFAVSESNLERLSRFLRRTVVDSRDEAVGRVADVVVVLPSRGYPPVVGLVVRVGRRSVFVPIDAVGDLDEEPLRLTHSKVDLRGFEPRNGEVLLGAEILRHRLIEIDAARFVGAYDVGLGRSAGGWQVRGIDTSRHFTRRNLPANSAFSDWMGFEPLIGHPDSARLRGLLRPLRKLKAAQIADLLESASKDERPELLDLVHEDPDLEADVFEEVEPDLQARLLAERSDADVAAVLTRMQADDAADAITDLPQERRLAIIDLLPEDRRRNVLALLGYNPQTAGGLMAPECIMVSPRLPVGQSLQALKDAQLIAGAAVTTIYVVDETGRLSGSVPLASVVRAPSTSAIDSITDVNPVHVHTDADVVELALIMSDYNLLIVPVTDADHRLLGVVTVDDVLETTIPADWRRRGPVVHARARLSDSSDG